MKRHFGQIFWGLLIVILDFSINGLDLLPDGLGYALMAVGCGRLAALSPRFSYAQSLCWGLAILWLIGFVARGDLAEVYGFAVTTVNCAMVWQLLGGIIDFARDRDRTDLAARAANRRLAYVAVALGGTAIGWMASGSRDLAVPLGVVLGIAALVCFVLILHLIHRVRAELATDIPS